MLFLEDDMQGATVPGEPVMLSVTLLMVQLIQKGKGGICDIIISTVLSTLDVIL